MKKPENIGLLNLVASQRKKIFRLVSASEDTQKLVKKFNTENTKLFEKFIANSETLQDYSKRNLSLLTEIQELKQALEKVKNDKNRLFIQNRFLYKKLREVKKK
jgi:hypothetical protein